MSMGGRGGGMRGGVGSRDAEVQRAENAAAPRIPNLLGRIGELFAPFRVPLSLTIVLVLASAGLGVLPPLLTQRAFDE
ncbi:ABC transporter ATP-binding protein, partial [Schumannella luteola]